MFKTNRTLRVTIKGHEEMIDLLKSQIMEQSDHIDEQSDHIDEQKGFIDELLAEVRKLR